MISSSSSSGISGFSKRALPPPDRRNSTVSSGCRFSVISSTFSVASQLFYRAPDGPPHSAIPGISPSHDDTSSRPRGLRRLSEHFTAASAICRRLFPTAARYTLPGNFLPSRQRRTASSGFTASSALLLSFPRLPQTLFHSLSFPSIVCYFFPKRSILFFPRFYCAFTILLFCCPFGVGVQEENTVALKNDRFSGRLSDHCTTVPSISEFLPYFSKPLYGHVSKVTWFRYIYRKTTVANTKSTPLRYTPEKSYRYADKIPDFYRTAQHPAPDISCHCHHHRTLLL